MLDPIVTELSNEYDGKFRVVKLDTDESPNVATDYGIRSIPTLMVFKGGKKLETIIGAVPKATLVQTMDKYVAPSVSSSASAKTAKGAAEMVSQ